MKLVLCLTLVLGGCASMGYKRATLWEQGNDSVSLRGQHGAKIVYERKW